MACGLCTKLYALAVPDPDRFQAKGCSSFLITRKQRYFLLGCFGSKYDETLFQVFKVLSIGHDDPVCDDCIDSLLSTGDLYKIPGTFAMVPLNYVPPMPKA